MQELGSCELAVAYSGILKRRCGLAVADLWLRTKLLNVQLRACGCGLRKLKFGCRFSDCGLKKKTCGAQHSLLYGLVVWGSTFPSYLKKLNSIQNKAVKLIGGGNYLDRVTPYYSKLNILKLPDLSKLETAKFVYGFMHNTLPQSFSDFFDKVSEISGRTTRTSGNRHSLYIPRYDTNRLQRSIKYQGVKIWNTIPLQIQNLPFSSLKKKL